MTTTAVSARGKRQPVLDHTTAMRLAATEYDRYLAMVRQLPHDAWARPTVCPGWDVHALVCHTVGMTRMSTSIRESIRQLRVATRGAKQEGGFVVDALTALQVREHADLPPAALVDALAQAGPAAARGRARTPALVRRLVPAGEQPIDDSGSVTEQWSFGYLNDVILTRDPWMHRGDLAAATGLDMELTADHDGLLVADVAQEWASRHGQPCTLRLTGPAGGTWTWGDGGPTAELDAVEFCRVLSGRGAGDGLLRTRVPF